MLREHYVNHIYDEKKFTNKIHLGKENGIWMS